MSKLFVPTAILLAATAVTACGAGPGQAPASPASSPAVEPPPTSLPTSAPTSSAEGLVHPTGPTDVILSYDLAGGFLMPETLAARVPIFTLYGDGTAVWVQTTAETPPRDDGIVVGQPVRTATLSEDQVQALLLYALQDGGLAVAKEQYTNPLVADAPSAVFTISADNDTKTVSAYGLGMEGPASPDSVVLKQLADLADRLANFDQDGSLGGVQYEAPAYRAVLTEQTGIQGVQIRDWPWTDLAVADFTFPGDPNALQMGTATITPDQAAALGIEGYQNGISGGVYVRGDDGTVYSLVLRPLLPHEIP